MCLHLALLRAKDQILAQGTPSCRPDSFKLWPTWPRRGPDGRPWVGWPDLCLVLAWPVGLVVRALGVILATLGQPHLPAKARPARAGPNARTRARRRRARKEGGGAEI